MGYLLHHLLSESAAQRPDAVAVRLLGEAFTYAELESRSNQRARALVLAGVRPGDRVGIHLGKSLESILSVFGILKAGACYVPVDISSPGRRLASIVRQCEIHCLITQATAGKKISYEFGRESPLERIFFIDHVPNLEFRFPARLTNLGDALAGQTVQPVPSGGTDQDLAYVLFTSGSTGEPKGVMLSHLNALTFVNWCCQTFSLKPDDQLANHAPLNFDLSVFDIFAGIKAGASVNLVPDGLALFPVRLAQWIEEHAISVWYSVPSVLTLLLTRGRLADRNLQHLRLVLFAGEVFPLKFLRRMMQVAPHARYFNLYGPTETNVCTYYEVEPIPETQADPIPIGRSCENTEVFALDEDGNKITSPGKEGLLYVRGSSVMQGYFGRPRETEAALIKNPFSAGREEKMYCTGDWVKLDERGNYHFLGRKDQLVKTRGYRVELAEIETVLHSHPSVREAAVVAVPDELLGSRIRAFVVSEGPYSLNEQEVKRHCAQSLPLYMVPEEVEFLLALPRTVTDKIDRPRLKSQSTKSVI